MHASSTNPREDKMALTSSIQESWGHGDTCMHWTYKLTNLQELEDKMALASRLWHRIIFSSHF